MSKSKMHSDFTSVDVAPTPIVEQTQAEADQAAGQETAEQSAPRDRVDWLPYGTAPVEIQFASKQNAVLHLRVASTAPLAWRTDSAATEVEDTIRTRAINSLIQSEQYARLVQLRPQFRTAERLALAARAKLAEVTRKRNEFRDTLPTPANLASRLVHADSLIDQARADDRQRQAEVEALNPLFQDACREVESMLPGLIQAAKTAVWQEADKRRETYLAAFLANVSEELTQLAAMQRAAMSAQTPRPQELFRQILDAPDADEPVDGDTTTSSDS